MIDLKDVPPQDDDRMLAGKIDDLAVNAVVTRTVRGQKMSLEQAGADRRQLAAALAGVVNRYLETGEV